MIDSTQAKAAQTECGAKPDVCSAQVAPLSARCASRRCMAMPMMTMNKIARPTAFNSTRRKGGVSIWAKALAAASSMGKEVGAIASEGKASLRLILRSIAKAMRLKGWGGPWFETRCRAAIARRRRA